MSRYVHVNIAITREELLEALARRKVVPQFPTSGSSKVMLDGSLECPGEPVDFRLAPGIAGAVEDFGFLVGAAGVTLVCGDVDRRILTARLLDRLTAEVAAARVRTGATEDGLITRETVEADGTRRIVVTRD